MDLNERFFGTEPADMALGYTATEEGFICLLCGELFQKGRIYSIEDILYDAGGAVAAHVRAVHGDVFNYLLALSPDLTGLSEVHRTVLKKLHEGAGDEEIARALGGRSRSTVRGHRFALRQRQRRAKIFLALMMLAEPAADPDEFLLHKGATMVDERFAITKKDREAVERAFIKDGRLTVMPTREKRRIIVIRILSERFERGRDYTEKQVNEIIKEFYDDFPQLRRYLVSYGFLDRERDGSRYWVKS